MTAPTRVLRQLPFLLLLALAQMSFAAEPAESYWFAFEPVKDRIKHGLRPFQNSAGDEFDPFHDLIPVIFPGEKERQDDRLGRRGDESF